MQGEGGDGPVHTREGSGRVFNNDMVEVVVTTNRESTDIELNNFEDFKIPKPTSSFSNWRDNSFNTFVDKNNETASNNSFNLDRINTEFENKIDNLAGVRCADLSGDQDQDPENGLV